MPTQTETETIKAFVASALESIDGTVDIVAHQDTIDVVGDTYTIGFDWVLGDDVSESDIPAYSGGELPLSDECDLTVSPRFGITDEHIDSLIMSGSPSYCVGNNRGGSEVNDSRFETLSTLLNEVHMSEERFVTLIEGDSELSECVQLVSVVQGGSEKFENSINKAKQMVGDEPVDLDNRIRIMVDIMGNGDRPPVADGIMTKERFTHVETLTIGETRYPVTITTGLMESGSNKPATGQFIHIGEFTASCDERTPRINLESELDHIDWREFSASESPWPEISGLPPRHQPEDAGYLRDMVTELM